MPYNGSGTYSPPGASFPAVANTLIESTKFNNVINDIATGLSTAITKDGQTTITANLPMGGYRHTGVGAPSARDHYATVATVQDSTHTYAAAGGTADAITLTLSPAITAYAEGQLFGFRATATNATTTPTLNINSVGAKTIVKQNGDALVAADITSGRLYMVQYYNNNFRLTTVSSVGPVGASGTILRSNGTSWVATTATYPATVTINRVLKASASNVVSDSATLLEDGAVLQYEGTTGIKSYAAKNGANLLVVCENYNNTTGSGAGFHAYGSSGNFNRDAYFCAAANSAGAFTRAFGIGVDTASGTYEGGVYFYNGAPIAPSGGTYLLARNAADNSPCFPSHTTTASAANAYLNSSSPYELLRSTSSLRYKQDVEPVEAPRAEAILELQPIWYRSKCAHDNPEWSWYGLSAEEVAAVEPRLVHWRQDPDDGLVPDGVMYERMAVLLLSVVKRMDGQLQQLRSRV